MNLDQNLYEVQSERTGQWAAPNFPTVLEAVRHIREDFGWSHFSVYEKETRRKIVTWSTEYGLRYNVEGLDHNE